MTRLLLVFLLLAVPAWACDIPRNVRISGTDPCAAYALIEVDWRTTLKRVWFASHIAEHFTGERTALPTEDIAAMGNVRFVAHPGLYFYSPEYGGDVYGIMLPGGDMPTIHYAEGTPAVLRHEIAHWFYWRYRSVYGPNAYRWVGHAVEGDPFWDALKAAETMWYE